MDVLSVNTSEDTPSSDNDTDKNEEQHESEVKTSTDAPEENITKEIFKKPVFIIGPRRGKAVGKVKSFTSKTTESTEAENEEATVSDAKPSENIETENSVKSLDMKPICTVSPAQKMKDNSIPLPYKEPKWGGIPKLEYGFEVLKNGKILEKCTVKNKSFFVFGRLSTCDFHMTHPTISRYHAVLQYRSQESEGNPKGFYIYDLGSTHGTFLNKSRIKPNLYVRIQVGHMLKLGCSTRLFVLYGPEEDMEEESELSVTQLKEKRQVELATRELEKQIEDEKTKQEEEQGIDWGMGEDADEETDLTENPFAVTQNEELYINDPKKTLRGWFEREGYELEYDVEEKGYGQFLCRVELPIENSRGGTMVAEALVKGKKKEAVVQCALEACRMLDRYGLLRQATHESKKRKAKDWEADDYYDSDEDTFLDRTGTVEKKRQKRMRAAGKKDPQEIVETYESLMEKHSEVLLELQQLELKLHKVSTEINKSCQKQDEEEEDALDAYMMELSKPVADKKLVSQIKSQLAALKQEEIRLRKLVNIAKPASLPELKPPETDISKSSSSSMNKKTLPLVGSRRKHTIAMKQANDPDASVSGTLNEDEIEVEEDEEEKDDCNKKDNDSSKDRQSLTEVVYSKDKEVPKDRDERETMGSERTEDSDETASKVRTNVIGPTLPISYLSDVKEIKTKVSEPSLSLSVPDNGVKKMTPDNEDNKKETSKRKNRNRRKLEQKNEKADQSSADYDPMDADYSTWVPPTGQTGDGRTQLNEKYGY